MGKLEEKTKQFMARRKLRRRARLLGLLGAVIAAALALFFFAGSADPSETPYDLSENLAITSEAPSPM